MVNYYDTFVKKNNNENQNELRDLNIIFKNSETAWALMDYNNIDFQRKWLSLIVKWKYTYYFMDLKDEQENLYKWMIIIHNPKQIPVYNKEKKNTEYFNASTHHFFVDLLSSYELNKNHNLWIKYPRKNFINNKIYDKIHFNTDNLDLNKLIGKVLKKDIYYNEIYQIRDNKKLFIKID